MIINVMTEQDFENIKFIYAKAFDRPFRIFEFYPEFHNYLNYCINQGYAFTVHNGTKLCGFIIRYERPNMEYGTSLYIELIAVLPEEQGKGYGKALIKAINDAGRNNHLKELSLNTACYMDSFHIYHHLGFKDTRADQRYMIRKII